MVTPALSTPRHRVAAALSATALVAGTLLASTSLLAGAASADATTATGTNTPGIDASTYSCGGTFSYGFEDRADYEDISGTSSGPLAFSTTSGTPWYVLSDSLNPPYSVEGRSVGYDSSANGRIDFTGGPVRSFSALTANNGGLPTLRAYDAGGTLLATAGPVETSIDFDSATQTVTKLAVSDTTADIAYVVFGGKPGFYVQDDLCVNGEPGALPQAQSITFDSTAPAHAVVGATYRVSAIGGASGNPVTYSIAPASAKVCTIDASGTVTFRRAGTCTVNADQAGNDDYTAAPTATQNISVSTQKANQAITFTSTAPAPGVVGGTYQATAQGGGSSSPVVFSAKSTSAKVCTVAPDGSVAFLKPGNCVVYATQAGDASYRPAPRVQQTVKVVR